MSESTTIDQLEVKIETDAAGAVKGIQDFSNALENLKKNSSTTTAVKNLTKLTESLRAFSGVNSEVSKLNSLASGLQTLKNVGSIASISNNLTKLATAMRSVGGSDIGGLDTKIQGVVAAVQPLSQIRAGGLGTMINNLKKLNEVTASLDDKTIEDFAAKVEKLNKALGPLSEKMTSIKGGFTAINSGARKAAGGVEELGSKVNHTTLNLSSMITIVQSIYQALQPVIDLITDAVNQATEWDGVAARFARGFGDDAQEVYSWIQRLNKEMGINIQQFMQYSSVYATMLTGFGVATKDAHEMALGYTELTYDIWAGYNDIYKTFDEAAEAVKSAIAGEVEPVRRAGFTIIESTLEQTAANHGLEISLANATEAQKSYLRYLTLVDQAYAQGLVGTYAKELNTAEGLMRTFSQQLKSLAQTFGSLFLPILVRVMPWLQAFVDLLTEAVYWVAGLFGIEIQKVDWSGINAGSGALEDVADSAGDAAAGIDDATKAAKELKNATLGIDELNVISPPTASKGSGGSGSGDAGAGSGFDGLDIDSLWDESIFDQIQSQVDTIKEKIKGLLPVIGGIAAAFAGWKILNLLSNLDDADAKLGKLKPIIENLAKGLAVVGISIAVGKLVWDFTGAYLESGNLGDLAKVMGTTVLGAALAGWLAGPIGAGIVLAVSGIVQLTRLAIEIKQGDVELSDPQALGTILSGGLTTALGSAFLGKSIATWITKSFGDSAVAAAINTAGANLGTGAAGATGAALGAAFAGIVVGIPTFMVGIHDALTNGLNWINGLIIPAGSTAAATGIGAIIGACGGPIGAGIGALIGLAVGLITDGIILVTQKWDEITAFLKKFFTVTVPGIWDKFKQWVKDIPDKITEFFDKLWQPIKDFDWYGLGKDLGKKFGEAIQNAIMFVTKTVPTWLGETWDKFKESCSTFFTETLPKFFTETIPSAFDSVVQWFKDLPKTLYDKFIEGIKWFKDIGTAIVDGIKDGLKSIGKAITDFVDGFVDGVKEGLGIHSPSTVFAEIGRFCLEGLFSTLGINKIRERVSEMWTKAKDWWNDKKGKFNDYTPTIGSIAEKVKTKWESARDWYNNRKAKLKEYTPTIGSIYDKVKTRWDNARDWYNNRKTKFKEYTPTIGSIYDKLKTRWDNARDWYNNRKAKLKEYTPTFGSIKDALSKSWSTAKSWWNRNVKLSIPSLSFKVTYSNSGLNVAQKAIVKALNLSGWPKLSFAAGGGIFEQGSMIWAGERGPEVVANAAGGKTGVMNVQQMQDAVYDGVYAAVVAAMQATGGNGNQAVNVYLDSRQITASVEQRQHERGRTIMGKQALAY